MSHLKLPYVGEISLLHRNSRRHYLQIKFIFIFCVDLVGGRPEGNGGTFFEVCRRGSLKVNTGKSKVMVLGR